MFLLGFKFIVRERLSDAEREEYKTKAKAFRRKMRDAFAVWDEEENKTSNEENETSNDRA